MNLPIAPSNVFNFSAVYGPVKSWRVGLSLGVDLLGVNSICSFKCNYCQLGKVNVHTDERQVYVPTTQVIAELQQINWQEVDAITLSGSGEPTLAANLGEVVRQIRSLTDKPVLVLTNASLLSHADVRRDLRAADRVFCKLDAVDEHMIRLINRPVAGITLRGIVDGIKLFQKEYDGFLAIQVMLQRLNRKYVAQLADLLTEIQPDEVQLNTPRRPVPRAWTLSARGNNERYDTPSVQPKILFPDELLQIVTTLRERTGLNIVSR